MIEFLFGVTIVVIVLAHSLLFAALGDIRQQLGRIERRQLAIADELDVDLYEAKTAASPRQSTRIQ